MDLPSRFSELEAEMQMVKPYELGDQTTTYALTDKWKKFFRLSQMYPEVDAT